jgi:hypothetical protein
VRVPGRPLEPVLSQVILTIISASELHANGLDHGRTAGALAARAVALAVGPPFT